MGNMKLPPGDGLPEAAVSDNDTSCTASIPPAADQGNSAASTADGRIDITVFDKDGGPLTKRIRLDEDGSIKSDGSACVMTRGTARRETIADVHGLAALIGSLKSEQAIALGALRGFAG